ncbi:MAG: MBL fold metallo-hydrolase [Hyphomicrobiaceae bacterium]|nr:MBL fold metallo-hydrolase [Hyphomicrobiaceae bacterium]
MAKIDRRQLMSLSGAAGMAALLPAVTIPGAPALAKAQHSLKSGAFEVLTFSDGYLSLNPRMAAPNADPEKYKAAQAAAGNTGNVYRSPLNVSLIKTGKELILVDVGSGDRFMSSAGKLVAALEAAGINAEQITRVIYTHAHPDHLWGSVNEFDELSFPQASFYISETEWNYWTAKDAITKISKDRQFFVVGAQRNLKAVKGRLKTVKPGDEIISGITLRDTKGHTPGHVSVEVGSGNDRILILGDALTHPIISFQYPQWQPSSDQVPDVAAATRQKLLPALAADKTRIIGYHLPGGGVGRVEAKGTGFRFAPGA